MRYTHCDMPRMFRVPFGSWFVPTLGSLLCILLLANTSKPTAYRFLVWTAIGQIIYFSYSFRHSKGRLASQQQPVTNSSNSFCSVGGAAMNNMEVKSQNDTISVASDATLDEVIVQYF